MKKEQLRESLIKYGQLFPIIKVGEQIIDGKRRVEILSELGRKPNVAYFSSEKEAATLLVAFHTKRAIELLRFEQSETVAELLDVRLSTVERYRGKPQAPRLRVMRLARLAEEGDERAKEELVQRILTSGRLEG